MTTTLDRRPAPCERCGRTHRAVTSTYAVGRFTVSGVTGYRGRFDGSPMRATREEAERDYCDRLAEETNR